MLQPLLFIHILIQAGDPEVRGTVDVAGHCILILPGEVRLKLVSVIKVESRSVRHDPLDVLAVSDLARAVTAIVRRVLVPHEDIARVTLIVDEYHLRLEAHIGKIRKEEVPLDIVATADDSRQRVDAQLFLRLVTVYPQIEVIMPEAADGFRVVHRFWHVAKAVDPVEGPGVRVHREPVDMAGEIDFTSAIRVRVR